LTFKSTDTNSVNIENTKPVFDDLPILTEDNVHIHVGEFLERTTEEELVQIKNIIDTNMR